MRPAVEPGMHAIRVAIEEALPTSSSADAVATDLESVLGTVSRWVRAGRMIGQSAISWHTSV